MWNNQILTTLRTAYLFVVLLFVNCADAESEQINVSELIEQCQSLEDDQPQEAIEIALKVVQQFNELNHQINYGYALGCLGWSYVVLDQVEESRKYARELEKLAMMLTASKHSVNLLRRAGSIYHRLGDRINAAENYQTAMHDAEKLKLDQESIPILINLGVLNSELRAHDEAIDNYYQALDLMKKVDDYKYHAPVLFNLAVTLKGQRRYQEAIDIYHQVESLIDENWPTQRVIQVWFGLATAYEGVGNYHQTQYYIDEVMRVRDQSQEPSSFTHSFDVFRALVQVHMGNVSGAAEIAKSAAAYYFSDENKELLNSGNTPLTLLAGLYEALGNTEEALRIIKISQTVDQQFQDSFNRATMAEMQARLNNSQQSEELAILKIENQKNQIQLNQSSYQRSMMVITIVFLLIILLLILLWQQHSRRQLIKLTTTDPLTGTKNRRGIKLWHQQLKFETSQERYLWLIDIDNFRKVNDEIGHDVGDTALQVLAKGLEQFANSSRCIGRWSGEEFLIITEDLMHSELQSFADEVLETITKTKVVHGVHHLSLNASIGVSVIKDATDHMWNRAISQADKALYVAKERGRNCMVVATDF